MKFIYVRVPAANVRREQDGPRRRVAFPNAVLMQNGDLVIGVGTEDKVIDLVADQRARADLESGSCIDSGRPNLDRGEQ